MLDKRSFNSNVSVQTHMHTQLVALSGPLKWSADSNNLQQHKPTLSMMLSLCWVEKTWVLKETHAKTVAYKHGQLKTTAICNWNLILLHKPKKLKCSTSKHQLTTVYLQMMIYTSDGLLCDKTQVSYKNSGCSTSLWTTSIDTKVDSIVGVSLK